jgi:peptide/nickel transport system substrate-binding protein
VNSDHASSSGALEADGSDVQRLIRSYMRGDLSRRGFLTKAAMLGVSYGVGSAILAACSPQQATQTSVTPKRGGTLRVAYSGAPQGFDPALASIGFSHLAIEQIYATLTGLDKDANPIPEIAQRWDISADGKQITFHLNKGVKFHNGDELTSDDVKFTFDRLKDPKTGYAYASQVATIDSVVTVDPYAVRFNLTTPTGPFLTFMAFPGSSIVPKKEVQARGNLSSNPIGAGAFKFVEYQPGNLLRLARHDGYFMSGRPYVDAFEMHIIIDQTARTNALQGGLVDFSTDVPAKDWAQVKSNPALTGVSFLGSHWHFVCVNTTRTPFTDPRVRQAVGYAVDRRALIDAVFFGEAVPMLGGTVPPWSWGYAASLHPFTDRPNITKAKQLLAAAGFPNGFRTQFVNAPDIPALADQTPLLQQQLKAVGIELDIVSIENPRWQDVMVGTHDYQMGNIFWLSPLADPDDFTYLDLKTKEPTNIDVYSNPKMDELLDQARHMVDQAKRKAVYEQIQALAVDEQPLIPTVNVNVLMASSKKVHGFVPLRTGFVKTLRDVWIG